MLVKEEFTSSSSAICEEIRVEGYERVISFADPKTRLKGIIAIHNTILGPGLGGVRFYPYSTFDEGLTDVLRLSKGMTYKSAIANTGLGGAKSVIFGDPKKDKNELLLLSFARVVRDLGGSYICAEDMGCTPDDMEVVSRINPYVVGLPSEKSSGDPSWFTAWGTWRGMQSVCQKLFKTSSLQGKTVAVQGLGSVGAKLAEILFWAGAHLILSDIDEAKTRAIAKKWGAKTCSTQDIFDVECDIFAPCALGGILNDKNIPRLRCLAVAGCANNQLDKDRDAEELMRRNILYAPDFVINAGGLINVTVEIGRGGYQPSLAQKQTHAIYDQLLSIYEIADQNRFSTHQAAIALADYRLKYNIGKREHPLSFVR